jgi:hypothetical protein
MKFFPSIFTHRLFGRLDSSLPSLFYKYSNMEAISKIENSSR